VASVGNLSAGGAGKTPFVILLGEELQKRGVAFDVLSRGYGRQTRGVRFVDPEGNAQEFGDEPLLIARRLGVPVWVGEHRFAAGLAAERKFGPQLHLLDDGFQHRALARDFDAVLVSGEDLQDQLLPFGRLREPVSALARADVVVFTNESPDSPLAEKPRWIIKRGVQFTDVPSRPVVFCGIARPHNFFGEVRRAGVEPAAEISFRDHHAYGEVDVRHLIALRSEKSAGGFLTTEKDAINLGSNLERLQPFSVARVTMEITTPVDAVDSMLRMIGERKRRT
jgi:tetraacyldisaccharide 4'-kinase